MVFSNTMWCIIYSFPGSHFFSLLSKHVFITIITLQRINTFTVFQFLGFKTENYKIYKYINTQ